MSGKPVARHSDSVSHPLPPILQGFGASRFLNFRHSAYKYPLDFLILQVPPIKNFFLNLTIENYRNNKSKRN
jgi:hypothetical protein